MDEARTTGGEESRERLGDGAFALLLLASPASALTIPSLGLALPNLAFPLGSLAILVLWRRDLGDLLRRHALLLSAVAALLAWTALSTLASMKPETSVRHLVKSVLYAVTFAALLVRFAQGERAKRSLRALLALLAALGLLGVVESFFPASPLFQLFRDERSLTILPRISSILPWPNPYGVLMAAGVALSRRMASAGFVTRRTALLASLLFLSQAAQSGSRNAWGVVALVLVVEAVQGRRDGSSLGAVGLAGFFAAALVLLPVAAFQLRIERSSPVARALLPEKYVGSTSLADPLQSLSLRGRIWRLAGECIRYQPVLGLGPGVFTRYATPPVMNRVGLNTHCLPLNLAVDLGLPGLALAAFVVAVLRPRRWLGLPAGAALAALFAGQVVDCFLYEPVTLLVMMACAASVAAPRPEP
ncbi:MAG: O-antigen ligase family protein [Holophagales bacterium]|jgi:hypothetical protein|nr:O-antigen ligase family protein [Holophagales bacterium]MBK9964390.1 O-antigen ligase family protein [Holophagales bacterium]